MPRPRIDFSPHKDALVEKYEQTKISLEDMVEWLKTAQPPIATSTITLMRQLHEWGVYKRRKCDKTDEVRDIVDAKYKANARDDEILLELRLKGYTMGLATLRDMRRKMGYHRRTRKEKWDEAAEMLKAKLEEDVAAGRSQDIGLRTLHKELRAQGICFGRDRLGKVMRSIDPEGVQRRVCKSRFSRRSIESTELTAALAAEQAQFHEPAETHQSMADPEPMRILDLPYYQSPVAPTGPMQQLEEPSQVDPALDPRLRFWTTPT